MSIISEADFLVADLRTAELVAEIVADLGSDYIDADEHLTVIGRGVFRSGTLVEQRVIGFYIDRRIFQVYHFREKGYYVVLQNYIGSCAGCSGVAIDTIESMIEKNVRRAYVTRDPVDLNAYIKQLKIQWMNESDESDIDQLEQQGGEQSEK